MRLLSGSFLIGFSLLALVLNGFRGGQMGLGGGVQLGDWYFTILVPIWLEILAWAFMAGGVGLIIWESWDIWQANKKGGKK